MTTTASPAPSLPDTTAVPPDRDRVVDLVRAVSLLVVALGHWLLAAVSVDAGGEAHVGHLLDLAPWTRWLTWGAQVIGVFMLAGAYANATSWRGHVARGGGYGAWLLGRAHRLLGPTVPFVVCWTVVAAVLATTGVVAPALLTPATQVVGVVLWFLAVYVLLVAAAPLTLRWHDRHGVWAVIAMAGAAVVVEVLSRGVGIPVIGWLQFALVWGTVHQLGYAWQDGSLRRAGARLWWALAVGGGAGLLLVTRVLDWYPVSMVGVPGDVRSNNSPPSLAIVLLGLCHLGVLMLLHRRLDRVLHRPRPWALTVRLGAISMSSYLWHLTGMLVVLAAALVSPWRDALLGVAPATGAWWAARPLWLLAFAIASAPFVLVSLRSERASLRRVRDLRELEVPAVPVVAGVVACCASFALLAGVGFSVDGWPLGLPVPALTAGAVGVACLRRSTRRGRLARAA